MVGILVSFWDGLFSLDMECIGHVFSQVILVLVVIYIYIDLECSEQMRFLSFEELVLFLHVYTKI